MLGKVGACTGTASSSNCKLKGFNSTAQITKPATT